MAESEQKIQEFMAACREKYGVNCGVCDNSPEIYHTELRSACESNTCGNFGKCWTCPPLVGGAEECIGKALRYPRLIVYQMICTLEDSFDYEGMMRGQKEFKDAAQSIAQDARKTFHEPFVLGAGGCRLCPECAAKQGEPCRHPEEALASLESYCIQVSQLAPLAGMKYINGQNTVTYFGAVFLDKIPDPPVK